ncbi:hypothetical protein B0A48_11919 [Cryoendolithus antarcticus]|uniref:Uncharacterized protein n=1 Tax=Cryoendolithus antarcticus TaxID=1507870 RepID=A0A1V8ST42_9PEZI|nr:hypothetical protein B0A48_11919 [Cryoendolithus antarcticus]
MFWNAFLDTHVPKDCMLQCDPFSFYKTCMELPTTQPALLQGLDALSMVQVGSVAGDRRLLEQATNTYARALSALHSALSSPQLISDDHVLAAAMVLQMCEFYTDLASPKGLGWGSHILGVQNILFNRGQDSFRSDLSLQLFAHARSGALCHALLIRKSSPFAEPGWQAVAQRMSRRDQSSAFHDIAVQVPGLLERYDNLELRVDAIDAIIAEAARIETDMRNWLASSDLHYSTQPISDFNNFATLCSDRTFGDAYMFANFMVASLYSKYWICLYFIRTTVRALHAARAIAGHGDAPGDAVQDEELLGYIVDLCHCIPYFCEAASCSIGNIGMFFPMRTAALYFIERGLETEAKWISQVRTNVLNKGLAPPSVDDLQLSHCNDWITDRPSVVECFLRR